MKKSSHHQVFRWQDIGNATVTRTQIYLAIAFIYLYFLTAIFF